MTAPFARQPLGGWRNEPCNIPFTVANLDTSAMVVRGQVRPTDDNPVLSLDLEPTADPNATGIRLVSVTHDVNGVPSSNYMWQVSKASMQALPFAGEVGDPWIGSFALQIAGITRVHGPFGALASPIDSDGAPANRPVGFAGVGGYMTPGAGFVLTIGTAGVTLSIVAADLMAGLLVQAQAAEQAAAAHLAAFPAYYAGANGGLTPTVNFGAIQNQNIPATVNTFLVEAGRPVMIDLAATDADVAAVPHCVTKSLNAVYYARDRTNLRIDEVVLCCDNGTDHSSVLAEALAYFRLVAKRNQRTAFYQGGVIEHGVGVYTTTKTIELHQQVRLRGHTRGRENAPGTVIQVPASMTGLIVGRDNSVGVAGSDGGGHGSAEGAIIEGLAFVSGGGAQSNVQFDCSGAMIRATCQLIDCCFIGFAANGIAVVANDAGGFLGNANEVQLRNCATSHNGDHGLIIAGNNVNCLVAIGLFTGYNGGFGYYNVNGQPATFIGGHNVANGRMLDGLAQQTTSLVFQNGWLYHVYPGQTAACAQTAPPGDGTNTAIWTAVQQAAAPLANVPQWKAGMALRDGGAAFMMASGGSHIGFYGEGTEGPYIFDPTTLLSGNFGSGKRARNL